MMMQLMISFSVAEVSADVLNVQNCFSSWLWRVFVHKCGHKFWEHLPSL